MERSHNMGLSPGASALNTKAWPSGDRANDGTLTVVLTAGENAVFSGGKTGTLIRSRADELIEGRAAKNSVAPRNRTAAIHAAHSRWFRAGTATAAELTGSFSTSSIWSRPSAMS